MKKTFITSGQSHDAAHFISFQLVSYHCKGQLLSTMKKETSIHSHLLLKTSILMALRRKS